VDEFPSEGYKNFEEISKQFQLYLTDSEFEKSIKMDE